MMVVRLDKKKEKMVASHLHERLQVLRQEEGAKVFCSLDIQGLSQRLSRKKESCARNHILQTKKLGHS
jgi:hypothetical protein